MRAKVIAVTPAANSGCERLAESTTAETLAGHFGDSYGFGGISPYLAHHRKQIPLRVLQKRHPQLVVRHFGDQMRLADGLYGSSD